MFVIHFLTVMCQAIIYYICVFLQKVSWPILLSCKLKTEKQLWICFRCFGKFSWQRLVKSSVKLQPTNMGFVNYSRFPLPPQNFRTLKRFLEKRSHSALINAVMKFLNFCSSGSKLQSVIALCHSNFSKNFFRRAEQ